MKNPSNFILILIAVALFYTFTSPELDKVKALSATASDYKSVIDNVARMAETRDALLVSYQSIPKIEVDRLGKVLPDSIDTVRLALDLDTLAGRYGIVLKDVKVDLRGDPNAALAVMPSEKPYQKALVSFSFVSNFENFRRMLGDLEKNLRIMDVKSVSFQTSESGFYEHQMTVETYWLK